MTVEPLIGEPGRLDAVVARLTGVPRADVQRAILSGGLTVDGEVRPKSFKLEGGERIEFDPADREPILAETEGVMPVRYADDHLLVIAKPAGLVTHPTANRRAGTLVNRLMGLGVPLSTRGGPMRPGIVHRLDAGTSGLMVIACTDEAHDALGAMLKIHAVERRYLALVRGDPAHQAFAVDAPLGRRLDKVVVDHTDGRSAETSFEVRERLGGAALLEAVPRTGRTHQIRVHLRAIGHPILGDRAYGGGGSDATALGLTRPFLHSWKLAFDHPLADERIELEEALPDDLEEALRRAREHRDLRP
ncbi:MAG: RluA family pseudouridine synthase [Actinomycetota bacterium]